jgi:hypothetical protein
MIKFFSKIRHTLIKEGKIKSYLLYAAGEIALVVVGILIALQINAWNESNKDHKLEKLYYCKFLEDVEQDLALLDEQENDNTNRIASINQLLHLLQKEKPARNEVVRNLREAVNKTSFPFTVSQSAFDDLKSSGKLIVLKDDNLKKKLLNYYVELQGYAAVLKTSNDAVVDVFSYPAKDFVAIGFQELKAVKDVLDSTLVDLNKLNSDNYPSDLVRKTLQSDAIYYIQINARAIAIRKLMREKILAMQKLLQVACATQS